MVSREVAAVVSPTPSRQIEFKGGFPVEIPQRQNGLDTESCWRQFKERAFQKKLANLSHHGDKKQMQTTIPPGGNGKNGVNHEIFIHFHQIFPEY